VLDRVRQLASGRLTWWRCDQTTDHDWPARCPYHRIRHAALNGAPRTRPGVGRHHDEVRVDLLGERVDEGYCSADLHVRLRPNALLAEAARDVVELLSRDEHQLWFVQDGPTPPLPDRQVFRRNDTEQHHANIVIRRKLHDRG
jgi:hypothetical protein